MKNIITKIIVFTIIASMLIAVPYPSQTKAADLVYTYWDLWYSLSSAANYSMQEKDGPFDGYDTAKLKDKAKAQFDDFKTWLQRAYMPVGITVDMLVNQADEMIANAKTTGLEMSQELWDAFRQYFDDVANDKVIDENFTTNYTIDNLCKYISKASGGVIPQNFTITGTGGNLSYFLKSQCTLFKFESSSGYVEYRLMVPTVSNSTLARIGNYFGYVDSSGNFVQCHHLYFNEYQNKFKQGNYCLGADMSFSGSYSLTVLGQDWNIEVGTASDVYSPFIDYAVTDACPQEVPEVIPWKVLPREITEEETKIKTNPTEDPDDDDKDKPAVIPPIHELPNPEGTEQESETEEDTEEETEETDTNKKPKPPKPEDMNDINLLADLTEIFPFCIPFDISRALKALKKESGTAPQFIIPFEMKNLGINEKVVIDFKDFEPLTKVIRSGVLVLYIIGLMWATSKVMKW